MDKFYLYKALQIAKSRLGFTAPNPAVGALIVNDGGVLSCGWHDFCGADHAEVMAIKNLKTKFIDDAVLYVTLEPCSHYGKTPPCVLAIISAGIKKVVYGLQDPNMEVGGRAIAMLAKAGVECYQVDLEEISEFYQFYQYWCRTKQSWFSAKLAITKNRVFSGKDGPIAITKSAANYWTHRQRCSHDAMLVTMKTIQKDNPLLTVRYASKSLAKPLVVLVAGCDFSLDYRCFFVKRDVLFIFSSLIDVDKMAECKRLGFQFELIDEPINSHLFWLQLVKITASCGYHSVWCELGGSSLALALQHNVLQDYYEIIANKNEHGKQFLLTIDNDFSCSKVKKRWLDHDVLIRYNSPKWLGRGEI